MTGLSEEHAKSLLDVLTSQPSREQLTQALRQFVPFSSYPSQSAAAITFAIIDKTIPELWRTILSDSKEAAKLIVDCLCSVAGVNALLMRLDYLSSQMQRSSSNNEKFQFEDVLDVLVRVLENNKFSPLEVLPICSENKSPRNLLLVEYMSLVGGSKILNVVSKATIGVDLHQDIWIRDGKRYSKWLGERLGLAMKSDSFVVELSMLLEKALNIGYPYFVIESLFPYCINDLSKLSTILSRLRRTILLNFSKHFLQYLSTSYLNYTISQDAVRWWDADRSRVGAVAGVLHAVYDGEKLADIFVDVVKNGVWIDTLPLQRACVLSVASLGPQRLDVLTDHLLASWSDKPSITHTPVMAQEPRTQMLLISLAHTTSSRLETISSSTVYNDGLSNRLAASVSRVRFLGMVVGEAVSRKNDPDERRLKFKVPETEDPSAEYWRSLIDVDDDLRSLRELQGGIIEEATEPGPGQEPEGTPAEEVEIDESKDLDNDLKTYPFPESDLEDSDEDPTLVSRKKTPAPLYIREVMKYLQANEYEKVNIGLKAAPDLVRRKATFGTELSDQAYDLARILVGLQDTFDMEEFQELRQAALIALTASAPEIVASYLISVYFTGDISIQQRLIILSALGLGARELAGLEKMETVPMRLLPPALHRQYISPMDQLSSQLESTMIEPIRTAAVTKLSGPEILQVRRFFSAPRSRKAKISVNLLSKIAGKEFVYPMLGRWWIHEQDRGGRGVHFEPILLSTFTRTVGIILHASAPSALDLREMTKEYWDFLLSLRRACADPAVAESILFGMLVILEINEPRYVAEHFPKQVVETQAWAADLFQGLDEGKAKILAGGILLRTKEIVEKHERLLLGDIISVGTISRAPLGLNLR